MSIRKFLLINLLLAIIITTTLSALGNYYLDQRDIQQHLDSLMALTTLSSQALLGDNTDALNLTKIQRSLHNIDTQLEKYYKDKYLSKAQQHYARKFNMQIWSDNGKLLLHTPSSPNVPLANETEGFSDQNIHGQLWRVFSAYNPAARTSIHFGERYDSRNELGHLIAKDDLYIMLLTFPLSGLLIWVIIGRGLSSLNRIAAEVSNRAPTHLKPVSEEKVPVEVQPLVDSLNQLFGRLHDGFEREKRFASDAAHELKTPLAALKTQAEVALRTQDPTERDAALKNVIAGVNRSTHIVQQLLTLSRLVPEAGDVIDMKKTNLHKVAMDVIAQIVPKAIEKNIDIELKAKKKSYFINANTTTLSILIRNLVDNAVRYTPQNGQVLIEIDVHDQHTHLTVTDNGPGIPKELRARVFERFFRILGNKAPGSGLGLAIVQQIAALHQAELRLGAPETGTGLKIDILFPTLPPTDA